jgi:hypothetical protein
MGRGRAKSKTQGGMTQLAFPFARHHGWHRPGACDMPNAQPAMLISVISLAPGVSMPQPLSVISHGILRAPSRILLMGDGAHQQIIK